MEDYTASFWEMAVEGGVWRHRTKVREALVEKYYLDGEQVEPYDIAKVYDEAYAIAGLAGPGGVLLKPRPSYASVMERYGVKP